MKLFKIFSVITILISITTQAIAEEDFAIAAHPNTLDEIILESQTLTETLPLFSSEKTLWFGSLSLFPGVGTSVRERQGSTGSAFDWKFGVGWLGIDTMGLFPIYTVDYNYCYYFQPKDTSFYVSGGIGAAYFIPYIPLRAGMEFKNGFMDLGAKMVLGFIPSPEVRAGYNFTF